MKSLSLRFFCVFICILIFFLSCPVFIAENNVHAVSNGYLRVITEDTPFYKYANEENCLFYLPYTYYVKVLGEEGEMTHVECFGESLAAIDGYVPTHLLFDDDLSVSSPYVDITLTTSTSAVLYSDISTSTPIQYVFPERQMRYYGSYPSGNETLYYVSYNGRLGYVKESEVYPFEISNHPNELSFIKEEEDVEVSAPEVAPDLDQTQPQTNDFFSLKVIIIVCLLFAGIVALFVALKQKPLRSENGGGYYDENDYE